MKRLMIILITALALAGCSTVTPDRVESREASFDGNARNSGVVESTPNGFVVTAHFRARYNALIEIYGRDFQPALAADAGITQLGSGELLITKQAMVDFLTMNAWRKARLAPVHP